MTEQFGWICPRCGKVHAPSVKECSCSPAPRRSPIPVDYDLLEETPWCSKLRSTSTPAYPPYPRPMTPSWRTWQPWTTIWCNDTTAT